MRPSKVIAAPVAMLEPASLLTLCAELCGALQRVCGAHAPKIIQQSDVCMEP